MFKEDIVNEDNNNEFEESDNDQEDKTYIAQRTEENAENTGVRRTRREIRVPERLGNFRVHLHSNKKQMIPTNNNETV